VRIMTHAEPTELMKPTDRSLDHPAIHTQTTTVGRALLGQLPIEPAVAQLPPSLYDRRNALAVGDDGEFASCVRASYRTGAGFVTPTHGVHGPCVHDEPVEVDLVRVPNVGQQGFMDPLVRRRPPASRSSGSNRSCRNRSPSLEVSFLRRCQSWGEDDPGEDFAIVEEGASTG
jgi:hypothetical protein